jgi:hypothetical protein
MKRFVKIGADHPHLPDAVSRVKNLGQVCVALLRGLTAAESVGYVDWRAASVTVPAVHLVTV